MVLTVGLAADNALAPSIDKKALSEILSIFDGVPERAAYSIREAELSKTSF
ncbi:MAG: hypothetical protein AAF203_11220 [Pseudomonadota bacterium]